MEQPSESDGSTHLQHVEGETTGASSEETHGQKGHTGEEEGKEVSQEEQFYQCQDVPEGPCSSSKEPQMQNPAEKTSFPTALPEHEASGQSQQIPPHGFVRTGQEQMSGSYAEQPTRYQPPLGPQGGHPGQYLQGQQSGYPGQYQYSQGQESDHPGFYQHPQGQHVGYPGHFQPQGPDGMSDHHQQQVKSQFEQQYPQEQKSDHPEFYQHPQGQHMGYLGQNQHQGGYPYPSQHQGPHGHYQPQAWSLFGLYSQMNFSQHQLGLHQPPFGPFARPPGPIPGGLQQPANMPYSNIQTLPQGVLPMENPPSSQRPQQGHQQPLYSFVPENTEKEKSEVPKVSAEFARMITVQGFEPNLSDETIEMYFENKKKSGGGDIEKTDHDRQKGVVHITFEKEEVAKRVLEQKTHTLEKKTLSVTPFEPDESQICSPSKKMIMVQGFDPKLANDTIEMYFENKKKSGGGDIAKFERQKEVAFVTFEDEAVAARVLERKTHTLEKKQLKVSLFRPGDKVADTETESSKIIEVQGFKPDTTDDSIRFYFESHKKSGGGEIANFERDEGVAYVTFEDEAVAEGVVSRKHKLEGQDLQVKIVKPVPMYNNKILVSNLPDSVTTEQLTDFFEAKAKQEPTGVLYGDDPGIALVSFEDEIDIDKVTEIFTKKTFCGSKLQVKRVPVTTCVTVRNFADKATEDTLYYYFVNEKKSGGKNLEDVLLKKDMGFAVLRFQDPTVAENVCHKKHTLTNRQLDVTLHFECLGSSGGCTEPPGCKVPDPVTLKDLEPYKVNFLRQTDFSLQQLKEQLSKCHCELELSGSKSEMILTPTFTEQISDARKIARKWVESAEKTAVSYMDSLVIEKISANEEIWSDVEMKLSSAEPATGVCVFTDEAECTIIVVGHRESVGHQIEKLTKMVSQVKKQNERKKLQKTVKKTFNVFELAVIRAMDFELKLKADYEELTVKFDMESGEITITGQQDEVSQAVIVMYEALHDVKKRNMTRLSKYQMQLLTQSAVRQPLEAKLKDHPSCLIGTWESKSESELIIYSHTEEGLEGMEQFLKDSVTETKLSLTEENLPPLQSAELQDKISQIKNTHGQRLHIVPLLDEREIVVAGISLEMKSAMLEVKSFIDENSIFKGTMSFTKIKNRFIVMHCQKEIWGINSSLQKMNVRIVAETDSTIEISGTKDGLQQAKSQLQILAKDIKWCRKILDKPGLRKVLMSAGEGGLTPIEKETRCVIDTEAPEDDNCDITDNVILLDDPVTVARFEVYAVCSVSDNKKVFITESEMLAAANNIDVLVIEANPKLEPDSDQARCVIDKAAIKEELHRYSASNREVLEGEVHLTGAGNLPCKYIVLAVGPDDKSRLTPAEILKTVVFESLEKANEHGALSAAIPVFNTRNIKSFLTLEERTEAIVDGIKTFFDEIPHSKLTSIYVCDTEDSTIQLIQETLEDKFGKESIRLVTAGNSKPKTDLHGGRRIGMGRRQKKVSLPKSESRDELLQSAPVDIPSVVEIEKSTESATEAETQHSKIRILLVKTDMGKEEADVLVNSTNCSLDLANGGVSKSLLKHAGPSIQQECKEKYPGGIKYGEIAITKNGNLQDVKHIYHTSLPQWKADTGEKTLTETMNKLLVKAHEEKMLTMGIPAMGTGVLNYPHAAVAKVMFETVFKFGESHPESTINDVMFVLHPTDEKTIQAFEAENQVHLKKMGQWLAPLPEEHSNSEEEGTSPATPAKQEKKMKSVPSIVKNVLDWFTGSKPQTSQSSVPQPDVMRTPEPARRQSTQSHPPHLYGSPNVSSSAVTLYIYADKNGDPDKAERMLIDMWKNKLQTQTLLEPCIKEWSEEQIRLIRDLQAKHEVTVKITKYLGRVVIEGLVQDLTDVMDEIHTMVRHFEQEKKDKENAEMLAQIVQWYFVAITEDGDEELQKYDEDTNFKIERAFKNQEHKISIFDEDKTEFIVDFLKMQEYAANDETDSLQIIRKNLIQAGAFPTPKTWVASDDPVKIVSVQAASEEFQKIEKDFKSTLGSNCTIIRIDRIQNTTLYLQYKAKSEQLEKRLKGTKFERTLWHGTDKDATTSISTYGFNRSYCDKEENAFGEGVYFTEESAYASRSRYSKPDSQNQKHVFQAKVLTGEFTKGAPKIRVPPGKDPQNPDSLYDSVCDDEANPKTFVIFSDTQAYPEYLIVFKL